MRRSLPAYSGVTVWASNPLRLDAGEPSVSDAVYQQSVRPEQVFQATVLGRPSGSSLWPSRGRVGLSHLVLAVPLPADCTIEISTANGPFEPHQGGIPVAHELPPLPYAYNALEPHIDETTMRIHHDKHHGTYVTNLNAALEKHAALQAKSIEDLLRGINTVPEEIRTAVRNNGGGHANHTMFWEIMAPGGESQPAGRLRDAIAAAFGGVDAFKEQFAKAAMGRFGSGWAWLVQAGDKLSIESTANQDSPLMERAVAGVRPRRVGARVLTSSTRTAGPTTSARGGTC